MRPPRTSTAKRSCFLCLSRYSPADSPCTGSPPDYRTRPAIGSLSHRVSLAFLGWLAVARETAAPRVSLHGLPIWLLALVRLDGAVGAVGRSACSCRQPGSRTSRSSPPSCCSLSADSHATLDGSGIRESSTWMLLAGLVYFAGAVTGSPGPGAQGQTRSKPRAVLARGGPNVFVRVMILSALAAYSSAASRRQLLFLLALPPLLLGAVLSGSRGGLLAGVVVLLLGVAGVLKRLPRGALTLSVIGASATVILVPKVLGVAAQEGLAKRPVPGWTATTPTWAADWVTSIHTIWLSPRQPRGTRRADAPACSDMALRLGRPGTEADVDRSALPPSRWRIRSLRRHVLG